MLGAAEVLDDPRQQELIPAIEELLLEHGRNVRVDDPHDRTGGRPAKTHLETGVRHPRIEVLRAPRLRHDLRTLDEHEFTDHGTTKKRVVPARRPFDVRHTTGDQALGDCILGKIKRWRFPADLETDVSYPFIFRPNN